MNIKQTLKEMDVKLGDFAKALEISRPTLNSYITAYENCEKIASEKHQVIFDMLFNDEVITRAEFMDILDKYHRLLERDKILGTLDCDIETTDLLTSIFERMREDVLEESYDEDIYTFINMFVRSYKNVAAFKKFSRYFLFLNGIKKIEEIAEEDKPFISNCFKLMAMDKENTLQIDNEYLKKFIERVSEIRYENEKKSIDKTALIKNRLEKMINEKIQEQLKLGLDIEAIDIDNIIKKLGFESTEEE